jgi:hypothetical protein
MGGWANGRDHLAGEDRPFRKFPSLRSLCSLWLANCCFWVDPELGCLKHRQASGPNLHNAIHAIKTQGRAWTWTCLGLSRSCCQEENQGRVTSPPTQTSGREVSGEHTSRADSAATAAVANADVAAVAAIVIATARTLTSAVTAAFVPAAIARFGLAATTVRLIHRPG